MRKVVLTFGLIAGAVLSALIFSGLVLLGRIGFDKIAIIGYATMVVAFLTVFLGSGRTAITLQVEE